MAEGRSELPAAISPKNSAATGGAVDKNLFEPASASRESSPDYTQAAASEDEMNVEKVDAN